MSVITPKSASGRIPILFWFHGSGGNAARCGGQSELYELAEKHGFALVCGEALQNVLGGHGGLWDIPSVMTDQTGTPCKDSDSLDITYIKNAIDKLKTTGTYDTTRIFMSGCSMGSAFSEYISSCHKTADPTSISAFATHSTGLKKKGDGLRFPGDFHHPGVQWGECSNCEYWPSVPKPFKDSLGLKACIFDNTGDGDFYKSSQAFVKAWKVAGNKEENHFGSGGHCQIHSFADIVNCLDDGTKRLLSNGPSPTPIPPSPEISLV